MMFPFPISKYKVYLDAETYQGAVEEAPDDVDVQEGQSEGVWYYEKDPASTDTGEEVGEVDTDAEGLADQDLEYNGFEIEEVTDDPEHFGVMITSEGIGEGDLIYVEHPDGDYIAEVESAEGGWDDWDITFGEGSYHLHPGTTSTPVGVVESLPELGPHEEIVPKDPSSGDIVAWEDPAGYTHYTPAIDVPDGADVLGVVEDTGPPDPAEEYDLVDQSWVEENTQVQDVEGAVEFNENLAEAIIGGDATERPAYEFMSFAGTISDPNLAIDAYESILENDGNKTQRERMERRLRGMGIDPENIRGGEIDPGEVPSVREGTVWSGFESQRAINLAAAAAHKNRFTNWETWNDFFDHMTEDELKAALRTAATETPQFGINPWNEPLKFEDREMEFTDMTPNEIGESAGAIMSRMPEGSVEVVEEIADNASGEVAEEILNYGASFLKSADDRRKLYEQGINHKWARTQFDASISNRERLKMIGQIHTSSTSHLDAYGLRACMWGYSGQDDERVNGYNNERPIGPIEPSKELIEAIKWNQEELIKESFETGTDPGGYALDSDVGDAINEDGTITLWRGVKDEVTGHSPVESWTVKNNVADNFDGAGVMEIDANISDILVMFDVNHEKFASEKEVTLLGGEIAGRAEVIHGDPIELMQKGLVKFDPDSGDFLLAPNREWVEAAIYDDMFDAGMFTEARAIDGRKIPIERVREMEAQREELVEEMASAASQRLSKALSKEWVKDPSKQAQSMRWRNTETGEYRYQESKPGGGGGSSGGSSDSPPEVDFSTRVSDVLSDDDRDIVDEIAANEWMSLAGQIDDPDLLIDALEPIQDHGTKTARDRIRRRLRGLGWDPEEIDEALSSAEPEEPEPETTSHDEWQEQYEFDKVEDKVSLAESGASMGVSSAAMSVHKLPDGTEAYFTDYSHPSIDQELQDNTMVTYAASLVMGSNVPPHKSEEGWYVASREFDGESVWSAPDSWKKKIDEEELLDEFAKQLIMGNSDLHGENVLINEEGEFSFIDLDHSTGRLDHDPRTGEHKGFSEDLIMSGSTLSLAFQNNESTLSALMDEKDTKDLMVERAEELAEQYLEDGTIDDAVEAASEYNEEKADHIKHNAELLANGEVVYP